MSLNSGTMGVDGRVVVLGAGIAGLCTALALAPTGRPILLLERDPPPPEGGPAEVFNQWNRRGASQLRHSHAFLARLRALFAREHPDLLKALMDAGAREMTFAEGLPDSLKAAYRPKPGDEDMAILISRRTTLESVIRAYVERRPNVLIRSKVFVSGLVTDRGNDGGNDGIIRVRGVRLDDGETVEGDIVVDAGGRASPVADWLADAGSPLPETAEDCQILYYTRFYERLAGQDEPPRGKAPPNGDLGYLKFGVFPADHGTFSITMAVPDVEHTLRANIVNPEIFEGVCGRLPGVAPWTDPVRSRPVSKVYAMGDLQSRWRRLCEAGRPAALNLFLVGDSLVRANPLYGRGCSFAALEAHALRDVLAAHADPTARAAAYDAAAEALLRPFYEDMREQDQGAARRARNSLNPDYRPPLKARLLRRFIEDGVTVAIRRDPELMRAAMRAFHMLESPRAWLQKPGNLAKVAVTLARGRKANARFYPERPGPDRAELFTELGLPVQADFERLKQAA